MTKEQCERVLCEGGELTRTGFCSYRAFKRDDEFIVGVADYTAVDDLDYEEYSFNSFDEFWEEWDYPDWKES